MKKRTLTSLFLVATMALGVLSAPFVFAQGAEPTPTATIGVSAPTMDPTPQPVNAPSPTPSPTMPPQTLPPLAVTAVEPRTMVSDAGGVLSVYGAGFTAASAVRLIGHGLLSTSYVNATALTAQVPVGLATGKYDLEVNDGTRRAALVGGLTVLAPTPTPEPSSPVPPPPPGRPILTVRNYAVEPAQVRPGQEFAVTIEIYNNGSRASENTLALFPGDPFLPVGESGRLIGQIHINHVAVVTQRMRAPSSLAPGVHQLALNLGANDWEGNHYDYVQQVPVEVIGGGGGGAPVGRPRVIVEAADTEPPILGPGEAFTLTLWLANAGNRTAVDVFAAVASDELAIPAGGGGIVSLGSVPAGGGITVTLPLLLGDVDAGGRRVLPIALDYGDSGGGTYSEEQNVSIDVDTGLSQRPQLVITEYATAPDFLTPGDALTLTVRIANVGGGDAERLTLALGGEGGAHLEPFIPTKASNVVFVPTVAAGSSVEITRQLIVDGSADPKAYNLPIGLAYDDARGSRREDVQRLSLIVRRRAELQATFYREPETLTVGSPTALSLELINVGLSAVNVVQVSASSPQMAIDAEGTPFMGPVEIGGSAPLDVTVTPSEGGAADIVISVVYRDDFNQLQVLTRTLTVEATDGHGGSVGPTVPGGPSQVDQAHSAQTVWQTVARAVRGFLGFGS